MLWTKGCTGGGQETDTSNWTRTQQWSDSRPLDNCVDWWIPSSGLMITQSNAWPCLCMSKNSEKVLLVSGLFFFFFAVWKINVFHLFFTFMLNLHVRCDNQYKTGADGGNILGQPMPFECMSIHVFSPAHKSEMRDYLVYLLIVKYLLILFKFSHSILDWTALSWNWGGEDFFRHF